MTRTTRIHVIWQYNTGRGHITAYLPTYGDSIDYWPYTNGEEAAVCRRNRQRHITRYVWPFMRYYPIPEVTNA